MTQIEAFCLQSNRKQSELKDRNDEIYINVTDRSDAHYRIPVADQEMNNTGLRRRASSTCAEGYQKVSQDTFVSSPNSGDSSIAKRSYLTMMGYLYFRRPFLTEKGFVGLAPDVCEVGDVVCVFLGARLPYVLREREDGTFQLIGEAYAHGIMYGEAWEGTEREVEVFELK